MGINRLSIVFYTFYLLYFTFLLLSHLADAFIQCNLQIKKVTKTITKLKVYKFKVKSL